MFTPTLLPLLAHRSGESHLASASGNSAAFLNDGAALMQPAPLRHDGSQLGWIDYPRQAMHLTPTGGRQREICHGPPREPPSGPTLLRSLEYKRPLGAARDPLLGCGLLRSP